MSKKWAKVKSTGGSISGVGTLELGKTKVRITFEDADKGQYTLPLSVLDDLPFEPKEGKDYYIALNGKGDTVYNIRPAQGIFTVRCVDFIRPDKDQTEAPEPQTRSMTRDGKVNTWRIFSIKLEIVDHPVYSGVTLTAQLPYDWFMQADDGSVGLREPQKQSNHYDNLESFLDFSGAFETVIDWDDENILPALLTVIKKAKKKFDVEIRDGYVTHYIPSRDVDEDDEEVETPKAKVDLDDDEPVEKKSDDLDADFDDEDEFTEDED
jgi:hypothetical protein